MLISNTSAQTDFQFLVDANNAFAWDLYAALQPQEGNLFFSPYSISTALAMTYAGARGTTAEAMAKVLYFPIEQEQLHPACLALSTHIEQLERPDALQLQIANALWPDKNLTLLEPFVATNATYYGANLFPVDFAGALEAARQQINRWVEEKTYQKIVELLHDGDLDSTTELVLTNAIYFRGNWLIPFDEAETREEPFWITPQEQIAVPMMHRRGTFQWGENDFLKILVLPYAGEQVKMGILVPQEKDSLQEIEHQLNATALNNWLQQVNESTLNIAVPKFKLSYRVDLKEIMAKKMGVDSAFFGPNFSGITGGNLLISKIIHQAFVEVHEKGTEAAAATAVVMSRSMPRQFMVDRPFIFFIFDASSQSLLFVGRVMDPTQ